MLTLWAGGSWSLLSGGSGCWRWEWTGQVPFSERGREASSLLLGAGGWRGGLSPLRAEEGGSLRELSRHVTQA